MESSSISVKALKKELTKVKDSALLIGFFKEKLSLNEEFKKLDMQFGGIISSCIKNNGFKAEKGEIKSVYTNKNIKNIQAAAKKEQNRTPQGDKFIFDNFINQNKAQQKNQPNNKQRK